MLTYSSPSIQIFSKSFILLPPFFLSDENVIIQLLIKTEIYCTCANQILVGDKRSQRNLNQFNIPTKTLQITQKNQKELTMSTHRHQNTNLTNPL